MNIPNKEKFYEVCKELEFGSPLTFRMIGDIFGQEFWEILVLTITSGRESQEALLELLKENR